MERRLKREEVMTIEVLHERGMSNRAIARQLGVDEKAVRYRLGRIAAKARDRRADQVSSVAPFADAIAEWMRSREAERGMNGLALYTWLVTRARIVLEPSPYEGESTERVIAPVPLGRMGRRMQEIWAMAPERRPIDQYAAYAEVAR